mmetsp:Transcript_18255/g.39446  ORF Transcript_18255/g.39446 Transcript_18255/m.39446 type:complete len:656 (+) Transcript_18255:76-2043(+)
MKIGHMTKRKNLNSKPAAARSGSTASWIIAFSTDHANSLVFLLLGGSLFCLFFSLFYIYFQLSGDTGGAPLVIGGAAAGLRTTRFMIKQDDHPSSSQSPQIRTDNSSNNSNNKTIINNSNNKNNHASSEDGLSACLLVNDENPRLPEWIAYHYHILPLRSLTVAVDPASRSSPAAILDRWRQLMGLDVQLWEEKVYMPYGGDGACNASDPHTDCLKHHRKRQQHFVRACMANFKKRGKSWVLLTDVDEYITFNTIHDTDPPVPLDAAPEGVPTLSNWTWSVKGFVNMTGNKIDQTFVEGVLSGLPPEGWHDKRNGQHKKTLPLVNKSEEIFYGAYGSVFHDEAGNRWFLRDDYVFRDAIDITPEEAKKSWNLSIVKNSFIKGNILHGTVYNNGKRKDGESVEIHTNWRESPVEIKTLNGGHIMNDLKGQTFYVERDTMLWPPHLSTAQLTDIRKRLPTVAEGKTVLDVINTEMQALGAEYAKETIGPCLAMPRVLYGSMEDKNDTSWKNMSPEGFDNSDFMTLRYRWHSLPDNRVNKYQKTIIDVRRISKRELKGEANNIHTPVGYYCRDKQPPRYSVSFFRVNHYLDSFEAYSYRNDARADMRQSKKYYNEKGKNAVKQMDDDIRPWLKSFVDSVGQEKANTLLAGAGDFVDLS